jgi:ATP-dependent Zn protease
MAGSLISFDAVAEGPISRSNLVAKVIADAESKKRVEDILDGQKEKVRAVLEENRDVHTALKQALVDRDELVGNEILEVVEKTLANRT